MNWKIFLLWVITFNYFLNIFYDVLYINSSKRPTPESLKFLTNDANYDKWMKYQKTINTHRLFADVITGIPIFILVYSDSFSAIGDYVSENYVIQLLAILGYMSVEHFFVELPFEIYYTFKIEADYGFNRTKVSTFILDGIAGLLFGFALNFGAALIFFTFYKYLNPYLALTLCILLLFLFVFVLRFVFPYFQKIFNKFTPLEDCELKTKLLDLMNKNNFHIEGIYVVNASKRSTKENAYFTGLGKSKRIVIYDTLIENYEVNDILAIFAHELGHAKHKDNIKGTPFMLIELALMVVILFLFTLPKNLSYDFGFDKISYAMIFICFLETSELFENFTGFIHNISSRKHEYAADTFAAQNGFKEELKQSLTKLYKRGYGYLNPNPVLEFLKFSHPSLTKRIDNIDRS